MPKSFAPEVQTDNSGQWYGNALRFATETEHLTSRARSPSSAEKPMSDSKADGCEDARQQPDPRPGFYYVSVRRDMTQPEYRLLRGPFVNNHSAALAAVDDAKHRAVAYDLRGCWYAYGTCRSEVDLGLGLFDKLDAERVDAAR